MSEILTSTDAGVTTLTFNRVDKKNAVTAAMYAAMADALQAAASDAAVRVFVFQGHETIFCAGNDISDFLKNPPERENSPVFRFLQGIAAFPKPLVAGVCGAAVGVGTTLLLHCDLVYAGDNAVFTLPFVNLGICPGRLQPAAAPRSGLPPRRGNPVLGEPVKADAALGMGWINRVVPAAEVNALARHRRASSPPNT